jgi:hypothetical protein
MVADLKGNALHVCAILAMADQRRHVLRWLWSLRRDHPLRARVPWITFDAFDHLSHTVVRGARVFEYGSGGSTLCWLDWGAHCVSIEHDAAWHARLCELTRSSRLDYRLVPPEKTGTAGPPDAADPHQYASDDPRYVGSVFRRYASQIDEFPDAYFDLVLVDGRARPSCIMHAAPKVALGGRLVLDDADRAYYTTGAGQYLTSFTRRRFYGVAPTGSRMWATDVYLRVR